MLYNRNTDTPAQCFFFDDEVRSSPNQSLPPFQQRPGRFMGCDDFPDLFDCIDGLCCPTRGECLD